MRLNKVKIRMADSTPAVYDFDSANPGITIVSYGNNLYDDCVIAARAHQTLRFDYVSGQPLPAISESEVMEEFFTETQQQGTDGLVLATSLSSWINPGWKAGGRPGRTILTYWGPYTVTNAPSYSGYASNQMNAPQVMTSIFEYTGVQVSLLLPDSIDDQIKSSYGPNTMWQPTGEVRSNVHVMLLTGYDQSGPIGITWGQKQHMSWNFLVWCCTDLYVIGKGPNT
jgi:hypothetical protein